MDVKDALAKLGTPEEIQEARDRLEAMDDVDMWGKKVHFSIHVIGGRVSVLVHEVLNDSSPLIGAFRFTANQWSNLKAAIDPLMEAHQAIAVDIK